MATGTGSAKIDRIIADANALGLMVEVRVEDDEWYDGTPRRHVSVEVHRPRLEREPANALEQVQQAQSLMLCWQWIRRNGNTPKLYYARRRSLFDSYDVAAKHVAAHIAGMAE